MSRRQEPPSNCTSMVLAKVTATAIKIMTGELAPAVTFPGAATRVLLLVLGRK